MDHIYSGISTGRTGGMQEGKRGPPMHVFYEDLQILPRGDLTCELMIIELEDEVEEDDMERQTECSTANADTVMEHQKEDKEEVTEITVPEEDNEKVTEAPEPDERTIITKNTRSRERPEKDTGDVLIGSGEVTGCLKEDKEK